MRSELLIAAALVGLISAAPRLGVAASAELNDLAARVHYGYYHAEPRVVAAALAALDRLPDSVPARYQRDFATLRAAQLGDTSRETQRRLGECAKRDADSTLPAAAAAEAWALVAACAFATGDSRRQGEALAAARRIDSDHPRAALVEAWAIERDAGATAGQDAAVAAQWAEVVRAFEEISPSLDDPGWGHAEALVALARSALASGEARKARDLVERALLEVPGYRDALELRARFLASGAP